MVILIDYELEIKTNQFTKFPKLMPNMYLMNWMYVKLI